MAVGWLAEPSQSSGTDRAEQLVLALVTVYCHTTHHTTPIRLFSSPVLLLP